jgi:hypothetical protein
MTGDAFDSTFRDENMQHIAASWESVRRHHRDGSIASRWSWTLEDDSSLTVLRVTVPLLPGDQRHDLGSAGEGHHADAVRL